MISEKDFFKLVHSRGKVTEKPHFERTAFCADTGKKKKGEPVTRIFVTYDKKHHRACMKLTTADQDLFSLHDASIVYPVPNKWGKQGWTNVELKKVRKSVLTEALTAAFVLSSNSQTTR